MSCKTLGELFVFAILGGGALLATFGLYILALRGALRAAKQRLQAPTQQ